MTKPEWRNPRISVIVLNWNRRADTLTCLASLQKQTIRTTILVVDNGSTDGTPDAVRTTFPTVEVLETGANLGYAGGNNVGIRRALTDGADAVMILNNDTIAAPDCIEHLVHELAHPEIAAAAPKSVAAAPPGMVHFAGGVISGRGEPYHVGLGCNDGPEYDIAHDTEWITGCAVAVRRDAFERIGLFDERFFLLFEDADWSLRARRAGMRLRYCPSAHILHTGSVSFGGKISPSYQYYRSRNHLLWLENHYPAPLRWKLMAHSIAASQRHIRQLSNAVPNKIQLHRAARLGIVHYFLHRFGAGPF